MDGRKNRIVQLPLDCMLLYPLHRLNYMLFMLLFIKWEAIDKDVIIFVVSKTVLDCLNGRNPMYAIIMSLHRSLMKRLKVKYKSEKIKLMLHVTNL